MRRNPNLPEQSQVQQQQYEPPATGLQQKLPMSQKKAYAALDMRHPGGASIEQLQNKARAGEILTRQDRETALAQKYQVQNADLLTGQ